MFRTLARVALAVALAAVLALFSLPPGIAGEKKTYGKGLSGNDTVKLSDLVADPDKYVGKTVRVEGLVTDVCAKRGCWMMLAGDKEFQSIRVKVDDGVIVFPLDAKGRHAVAEGIFTVRRMTLDESVEYLAHVAEENKKPFDRASVKAPITLYTLQGTGAVID
jgi:hypothetical protein